MKPMYRFLTACLAITAFAMISAPADAGLFGHHAGYCAPEPDCCPPPVCCPPPPPPPVEVFWCVKDPVTCCTYEVSACVPACCAGSIPCLAECRRGLLGRKILTYEFACGHCVDVVITKFGRTIVR